MKQYTVKYIENKVVNIRTIEAMNKHQALIKTVNYHNANKIISIDKIKMDVFILPMTNTNKGKKQGDEFVKKFKETIVEKFPWE